MSASFIAPAVQVAMASIHRPLEPVRILMSRVPRPSLPNARRTTLAFVTSAILVGGALACADATSPTKGSTILDNSGGGGAGDTTQPQPFDRHRYAGRMVWPSTDSLRAWSPAVGVRVDLLRIYPERSATEKVATTTTDADGHYVLQDPTQSPQGILAVQAHPAPSTGFRTSPLGFPLVDVPLNARYWTMGLERIDAPFVDAPVPPVTGEVLDAPAWGASGPGVPGVVLAFRKILRERHVDGGPPVRELADRIEYGVADAQGRFAVALRSGPGSYLLTIKPPAGYYVFSPELSIWVEAQGNTSLAPHPLVLRLGRNGG